MKLNVFFTMMFAFLFTVVAFAADAPTLDVGIVGMIDAIKIGSASAIILAAVQLLKTQFFGSILLKLDQKIIPWITLVIAILGNIGVGLAATDAKPIWALIIEGVLMALGSNGLYEVFKIPQAKA